MPNDERRNLTDDEWLVLGTCSGFWGLIAFALACIIGPLTVGFWSTIPMSLGLAIFGVMFGSWLGLRSIRKAARKKAAERTTADREGHG